jgi:hypothetical protein
MKWYHYIHFKIFNYNDSFGGSELCEAHYNMLLTLSNPCNIHNHNYGIMSLFIKTHWMAGRQEGRQASRQASKHWGRQTKESKTRQVRGHPGYYHSHNHKCE